MNKDIAEQLEALVDKINEYGDFDNTKIKNWLFLATVFIWSGNKFYDFSYAGAVTAFTGEIYNNYVRSVQLALDYVSEEVHEAGIPEFFGEIVRSDLANDSNNSREIIDEIGKFLVSAALVNGDFTIEEANKFREVIDGLKNYCDENNVKEGKTPEYYTDRITPLNDSGYCGYLSKFWEKKEDIVSENEKTNTYRYRDEKPSENISQRKIAEETLESTLAELNSLVGLEKVKTDIQSMLNFIKVCKLRSERGMKVPTISYHLVFTGNPGTGKTTVARLVAKLYHLMGILPQGQLVETDRSGLVAGYLGQTAIKTQQVIQKAIGGVLFIDEAYSLVNDKEDSYGKEAVETLLKAMEDHRDELVVIVAGYDGLMQKFIDSNPGLRSRFNKYFNFPDYDGEDLLKIFLRFCDTNGYTISEPAVRILKNEFDKLYENRSEHFGNARAVRNLFENAINRQANRIAADILITDAELAELIAEDVI